MSRIRKSFPPPPFSLWIYFFCAYHLSIATCPFVVIAYHLLRQGWLRTVRGNLTTTFISIFVLCFPSLALMTTYLAAVFFLPKEKTVRLGEADERLQHTDSTPALVELAAVLPLPVEVALQERSSGRGNGGWPFCLSRLNHFKVHSHSVYRPERIVVGIQPQHHAEQGIVYRKGR